MPRKELIFKMLRTQKELSNQGIKPVGRQSRMNRYVRANRLINEALEALEELQEILYDDDEDDYSDDVDEDLQTPQNSELL